MVEYKPVVGLLLFLATTLLLVALRSENDLLNRWKRQTDAVAASVVEQICPGFFTAGGRCIEMVDSLLESQLEPTINGMTFYEARSKCKSFPLGFLADVQNEGEFKEILKYIAQIVLEEKINSMTIWINVTTSQSGLGIWCQNLRRQGIIALVTHRCVGLRVSMKEGGVTPSPNLTSIVTGQEIDHCLFTAPCSGSWRFRPLCSHEF